MQQIKSLVKKTLYMMNRSQIVLCFVVLIITAIGSLLECLGVSVIIPLVNVIQEPDSILQSSLFKGNSFLQTLTYHQAVGLIGGCVIVLYIIKNLFFIFMSWLRSKFSCKIQREMAVKMLSSYLSRGYQFFLIKNWGELSRGVEGDTAAVYNVLNASLRLLSEAFTIALICGFMFVTDWVMAISMVALALICLLLIYFLFRKKMYKAGEQHRKYNAKANQALIQAIQGAKDVLLLRKQRHFINAYEKNQVQVQNAQCKQVVGGESPAYIIEGICVSGLMLIVCLRVMMGDADPNFIAVLASFAVGAFRILPSLGKISTSLNLLTNSLPSVEALYKQVIEAEEYAREHPDAVFKTEHPTRLFGLISKESGDNVVAESYAGADLAEKFHKELLLENISFRYREELEHVLQNVHLSVKKGQAVALIGASGAGKSTLVDILLGLLVPQQGTIYMDGIKITDIPEKWSETVGYVPQAVFLSATSIKENVAFGEEESEIDIERVREALERAELLDFVDNLPDGIETYVGDRGVQLSGGQRQRIAIARALYYRPEIMVLDEATSALDNDTEAAIMSAIDSLQGHVTLIIVAHRLSTVKNCDVIYEVRDKNIFICDKNEVLQKSK